MTRFTLFAAHDGATLIETINADDEDVAREMAFELARKEFNLYGDIDEGELDGFHLEEMPHIERSVLRDIYESAKVQRQTDVPWIKADGKTMTKAGRAEALVLLYGIHRGLELAGHPGISPTVFLASVRSAEEVLNETPPSPPAR